MGSDPNVAPFEHKMSLDLYLTLKPLKTLLKLPALKQPCLEEFLGIKDRIYNNGKECIQLYKDFLKKRDAITAEEILGHNLEDVLGLGRIFEMLSYLCIYDSEYEVTYAELDDENLILELTLPYKLPQKFSNGNEQFYLTGEKETISRTCTFLFAEHIKIIFPKQKHHLGINLIMQRWCLSISLQFCIKKLFFCSFLSCRCLKSFHAQADLLVFAVEVNNLSFDFLSD